MTRCTISFFGRTKRIVWCWIDSPSYFPKKRFCMIIEPTFLKRKLSGIINHFILFIWEKMRFLISNQFYCNIKARWILKKKESGPLLPVILLTIRPYPPFVIKINSQQIYIDWEPIVSFAIPFPRQSPFSPFIKISGILLSKMIFILFLPYSLQQKSMENGFLLKKMIKTVA